MKLIYFENIVDLKIPPEQSYDWVREVLVQKDSVILPPKISMKQSKCSFCNVMPSVLPGEDVMGVKIVMRYPKQIPSLTSQIILYRQSTGESLALMDGTYITALRTGAVAAYSMSIFGKKNFRTIAFIGLGNSARATLLVHASVNRGKKYHVGLLRYKHQAKSFIERFKDFDNLEFSVYESVPDLIKEHDVVISSVSYMDGLFADDSCYKPGCTIIPIHTRGFQNCDLFFDKVFSDDRGHVDGFEHYDKFRSFAEIADVLANKSPGRSTDKEKILVYNIGLSIYDIYIAYKVYSMLSEIPDTVSLPVPEKKFWV